MAGSSAKRLVGSLLFLLAALAVVAFVFLLYADAINDDGVPLTDEVKAVALVLAIVLGAIAIALLVMMLSRRWSEKAQAAEEAEVFFIPEPTPGPTTGATTTTFDEAPTLALYDLAKVPVASRAWSAAEVDGKQHPFYFPRSVPGGIYVNDYIPIDGTWKLLKLRTLLGGPFDADFAQSTGAPRRRSPAAAPRPVAREEPQVVASPAASSLLLQEVATESLPAAPAKAEEVYFDYPGDNHEVEDLEGIGPTYGKRLREAGVHTTARLCYEDAGKLATAVQVPRGTVEAWQQMAQLVKVKGIGPQYAEALVRAGIAGIEELKRRSPARMADQINGYLATLDVNVLGTKITEKRVEGWKESAKQLKRVRLAAPAQ